MFFVYKYQNKINNKVYIGKTGNLEERKRRHKMADGSAKYFHAAIKKNSIDNFDFTILGIFDTDQEAIKNEIYYIDMYKSNINRFGKKYGYNLTDGGEGHSGNKNSKETKIKKSKNNAKTMKGKFGISHPAFGCKRTEKVKQLLSNQKKGVNNPNYGKTAYNKGIPPSEEARKNMSISHMGIHDGENNPAAKLKEGDVLKIKQMINDGFKNKDISILFSISKDMISKIRNNKNWSHIKLDVKESEEIK